MAETRARYIPTLATPARTAPLRPVHELYPGRPALAVQFAANEIEIQSVGDICAASGVGAVITLPPGRPLQVSRIKEALDMFQGARGDVTHALIDANRYAGTRRIVGASTLDHAWVDAQLDKGQRYALTDSPYIPDGDFAALESTLAQGRAMGRPVIVNLPISYLWLKNRPRQLRDAIDRAGVPVALTVEHSGDPMGGHAVVAGLVHVLGAEPPVFVLRCDASAIVALAYGAAGGAIGTTTSLRHLYPLPNPGAKSGRGPARVAVWVPRLLAYMSIEKVSDLVQYPGIDQYFLCDCTACNGLCLDRVVNERQAYEHSLRAMTEFATTRFSSQTPAAQQRLSFYEATKSAQFAHMDIEYETGVELEPPAFLGAWKRAYERPGT